MEFLVTHMQQSCIFGTPLYKNAFLRPQYTKMTFIPLPILIRIALIENYFCENFKILEELKIEKYILYQNSLVVYSSQQGH